MARPRSKCGAVVAAFVLALLSGCNGVKTGDVSGKVTYKGKPLAFGSVIFLNQAAATEPVVGTISPDGTYTVHNVVAGEAQVGVVSPDPNRPMELRGDQKPLPPAASPKLWFPIPERYSYPVTSGLSYSVSPGPNAFDINLK